MLAKMVSKIDDGLGVYYEPGKSSGILVAVPFFVRRRAFLVFGVAFGAMLFMTKTKNGRGSSILAFVSL